LTDARKRARRWRDIPLLLRGGGVRFGEKFLDEKNLKKWRRRVVEVCDWWGFCGGIKVDDSPWL
jgi:hypothetical protein